MDIRIGRNVINASTSDFMSQILGYVFWIVLALATDPKTVGGISLILTFMTLVSGLVPLGIDSSVMKKIGTALGYNNKKEAFRIIKSSSVLISIFLTGASVAIFIFLKSISTIAGLSELFVEYSIILIVTYSFQSIFRNIILALQEKTIIIVYAEIISQILKFGLTFGLLFAGFGLLAIVIGFIVYFLAKVIILAKYIFGKTGLPKLGGIKDREGFYILIREGIPSWIPAVIGSYGYNLGILLTNLGHDLSIVGIYYVAIMIYSILTKIPSQVQPVLIPVFSGLKENPNMLIERALIFSLIVVIPFTAMVMFYPQIVLGVFGSKFVDGKYVVFLLSTIVFFDVISASLSSFHYSRGFFRNYIVLTMSQAITRIIFYFILVPHYGSVGAAQAMIIGSAIGFILTLIYNKLVNIKINWIKLSGIGIIPVALGLIFSELQLYFVAAFTAIFLLSIILYIKLKILERSDIEYGFSVLLPQESSAKFVPKVNKLLDKLKL